jgi:transmembrane sensor
MEDDKKDLEDFLSGKRSKKGKQIFEAWYESVPERNSSDLDASGDVLKEELKKIKERTIVPVHVKRTYSFYWKAAAAVALIIVSTGLLLHLRNTRNHPEPVASVEQIVPRGKITHLTLPDGTQVWLNADSKFTYPEKFSDDNREVYLVGEAFFDVKKDPAKPFRIHSENLTTTVLGTSFNVRAYHDDDVQEVAVITGKVSVIHDDKISSSQEIKLVPGEKALLTKQTGTLNKLKFVNYGPYTSWKEGKLIFENTRVSEVVLSLERRFNIEIKLESESMRDCRVTASFDGLPVERIMYLLCYTLKEKYSVTKTGYLIHGQGCTNTKTN